MSDRAVAERIGHFVQDKRLGQNKTQSELAKLAGISRSTLSLLERGEAVTLSTLIQVLRQLGSFPVFTEFIVQQTISPIALAKMETQKRKHASHTNDPKPKPDW